MNPDELTESKHPGKMLWGDLGVICHGRGCRESNVGLHRKRKEENYQPFLVARDRGSGPMSFPSKARTDLPSSYELSGFATQTVRRNDEAKSFYFFNLSVIDSLASIGCSGAPGT
jgi:hypothetical protein